MKENLITVVKIGIVIIILQISIISISFSQVTTNSNSIAQTENLSEYKISTKGFVENKGQITDQNYRPNPAVKYLFCSQGFNVQLRQTGFSYDTYTDTPDVTTQKEIIAPKHKKAPQPFIRHYHRVDIELSGCNVNTQLIAEGKSDACYNYITSGAPQERISDVHYYAKVVYKNIYPNIDLEFNTSVVKQTSIPVEYQFVVHPGGNPNDIKLSYQGANEVGLDGGKLVVNVNAGEFTESIPSSYLRATGQAVQVNYAEVGDNGFAFSLPDNLALTSDLVIDPVPNLLWGTYYGGSDDEYSCGIAVDDSDNAYITGYTISSSNIATSGAYQTTYGGSYDAFVAKFNSTGTSLLWGTYYGGTGIDQAYAIAVDASNNVYITGISSSTSGIATMGIYQATYGGGYDAFIAKFNSGGSLLWGTYYGGTGSDWGGGIAVNASGDIYITGETSSTSGIATSGSYQTTFSGDNDVFVAEFNSTGTSLLWGSYYGTSATTMGDAIALDASNNVYITGYTQGDAAGIATVGAYQTTYGGDSSDAFAAKFNSTGTSLVWGTYYGGAEDDYGYGIGVDTSHNVYITGYTQSTSGIATSGGYQTSYGTQGVTTFGDAFIAKFNSSGSSLLYGTYYGGESCGGIPPPIPPMVEAYAMAVDKSGNVYITGQVNPGQCGSANMVTSGAYQTTPNGLEYCYVSKFDLNLSGSAQLVWGTYYGGTLFDYGYGIALDAVDNVYVTGYTDSNSGMATTGAYQTTFSGDYDEGDYDVFVAKFSVLPGAAGTITGTTPICQGQYGVSYSVPTITNATGYVWTLPAGATIASGANTHSITVNFSPLSDGGTISAYGTNSSGNGTSSSFSVTINTNCLLTIEGNGTHRSSVTCNCVPSSQ